MKQNFLLTFSLIFIISCSNNNSEVIDYNDNNLSTGGVLINAMSAEPSNLISMIAGDSASSAIASKIFNSLIRYDENLNFTSDIPKAGRSQMIKKPLPSK